MNKKAVILARVSTLRQEKEGLSLKEIQLPLLQKYAADKGFEVVQEFVFSETAGQKIRTKFNEMINFVKKNKNIKAIITYRVDRMTRNFRDAVAVDELIKEHDKEIHFVDDRLVINKYSAGRDIQDWDLKVFLAKQLLTRLRDDALKSAAHKVENGEWPGQAPYGYKNIDLDRRRKWVVPDEQQAPIVRKIFELYIKGTMSINTLRNTLQKEFHIKLSPGTVHKILINKFYIGTMEYDGNEYSHNYERLVAPEVFNIAQRIREEKLNGPKRKLEGLPYMYRGMITCADCGCAVTPEIKKKRLVYYKCTQYHGKHGAQYIREEDITKQIYAAFKKLQIESDSIEYLSKTLQESHDDKKEFTEAVLTQLQADYARIKHRLEKLYDDKLDGNINNEEYLERQKRYRASQEAIEEKLTNLRVADQEYYDTVITILLFAAKSGVIFKCSEPAEKRHFLNILLSNLKLKGRSLLYDYRTPFSVVAKYAGHSNWQGMKDLNLRRLGS